MCVSIKRKEEESGGGDKMNWYVLVWDTENGRSKMYYGDKDMGKIVAAGSAFNLPSSPL